MELRINEILQQAITAHKEGKFEEAVVSYKKLIELKPDYAQGYNNLGIVLFNLYRFDEAKKNYKKAIELKPDYANAYNNLGIIFNKNFDHQKAIDYFKKAIEIDSKCIEAFCNLVNSYLYLEKYDKAIEKYSQVLELNPKHIAAQATIISILDFFIPDNKNKNLIIAANNDLKKIKTNFTLNYGIKKNELANVFENANKIIQEYNKELTNNNTQVYRRNSINLNCERHFEIFNKFNIIPKFCFSCFKIQIEPKNVLELFKLYFIFDKLELPKNNLRKCMIEMRPKVSGTYKGFIYCSSTDETTEILKIISPIINKLTNSKVKIKRGCSEYADVFPSYKEINKNNINYMKYRNEWEEKEKMHDTIKKKNFNSKNSLCGLSISDVLIINNWLSYAKAIDDLTYKNISEETFDSTFIYEQLLNQLDMRKKEFYSHSNYDL